MVRSWTQDLPVHSDQWTASTEAKVAEHFPPQFCMGSTALACMSDTGDVIEPDPAAAAARRIGPLALIFFSFSCFFSFSHTIACHWKETHLLPLPSNWSLFFFFFTPLRSDVVGHYSSLTLTTTAHFHHWRRFSDRSEKFVVPRIVCAWEDEDRLKRGGQTSSAGWLPKVHVISHTQVDDNDRLQLLFLRVQNNTSER